MVLTRSFRETVMRRVQRDPAFRAALIEEAAHNIHDGDIETALSQLLTVVAARVAELPAIWQDGELRGELVRLDGDDDTKYGTLAGATGDSEFRCTPELARDLRHHLWDPIRVIGRGRWQRGGDGAWLLLDFRADRFESLDDESIADTVGRLRANGGFGLQPGAMDELEKLRET